MNIKQLTFAALCATTLFSCNNKTEEKKENTTNMTEDFSNFQYATEQVGDVRILRYNIPGFNALTVKQKELLYYLSEAALAGRDIIWDQNCRYNLPVRKTLEAVFNTYKGDKTGAEWDKFSVYAKRVFFSNGIHHHYSNNKLMPECDKMYFMDLIKGCEDAALPLNGKTKEQFAGYLIDVIYNPAVAAKRVSKDPKTDMIKASATNFYGEGVTQAEVSDFYKKMNDVGGDLPMFGLNSQLVKENGQLVEKTWKVGGMYSASIEKIVFWLEKAIGVAENDQQKKTLEALVKFYKSGDLKDFDTYNIEWVKDTESMIDVVNGFIEVYGDPLGFRGSYESVVSIRDMEATKRIKAIGDQAQWFENNSPIDDKHKKANVQGISAKVITVVQEAGDAAPSTPIGINLPNSNWIREKHGSKSVNLSNIVRAYNESSKGSGMLEEFFFSPEMIKRAEEWGAIADDLHTDMHEVIGHASGILNPGIKDPSVTLKNYASTLEEARADLVALYYLPDPKLKEIGVVTTDEIGKAAYDDYITNGLMIQLTRIPANENQLEEDHMRNRQLVAKWAYEKGKADNVIELKTKDGKSYFVVNDYAKLRVLFGQLLREIQRLKSEGDYKAGHDLVEGYGVQIDPAIHKEVLERYAKLKLAPYKGFIQPKLVPVMDGDKFKDVKVEYPSDFLQQMLYYGKQYGNL